MTTQAQIVDQVAASIKTMLAKAVNEAAFDIQLDEVSVTESEGRYLIELNHGTTPIVSVLVAAIPDERDQDVAARQA